MYLAAVLLEEWRFTDTEIITKTPSSAMLCRRRGKQNQADAVYLVVTLVRLRVVCTEIGSQ